MTFIQVGSAGFEQQPTVPWSRVNIRSWSMNWAKMVNSWVIVDEGRFTSGQKVLLTNLK